MRTGNFLVKYRWWIIAASVVISGFFGFQIFREEINPDLETYIYEKMPSRINTAMIEDAFGGDETVMVVFEAQDILKKETLERIRKVSRGLGQIKGIDETLSLFSSKTIKGGEGTMIVEPTIGRIPSTRNEREALRKEIRQNDLVYKSLVSPDFTKTCIIAILKTDVRDEDVVKSVEELVNGIPGPEKILVGGLPYIKAHVAKEMAREFKVLMIIGLAIMLVMLYFFFREIRGVLLPFVVVIMSILFAMGLMPMIGWQMSIITLLLPIMLIAIANDYGIHMMARYQEYNTPGNGSSMASMARGIFTSLRGPIVLAGITTIAGFLCLLSHKMLPARQLGVVTAAGIAFALLLSLVFIPATLSAIGKSKPVWSREASKRHPVDRILNGAGRMVTAHPVRIIAATVLIALISAGGIFLLRVDTNLENFFPKHHPVRVSSRVIDKTFGGSRNISIMVEGDILDPRVMKKIDRYERELGKNPSVGQVRSIAGVVREISKALNNKSDSLYDRIPGTRNAIAQYMELYLMSGDPGDLERLVDFDFSKAQVIVRINDGSDAALKGVLADINTLVGNDRDSTRVGGYGLITADLADLVVRGQITSLITALLVILLLITLSFRSLIAGLIGSVPLLLAIIMLFGWMGFIGIRLDIATALLSSIMIGVGVDYTIHFLWRYRSERGGGLEPSAAVVKSLTTTGRGIVFNAFSVIFGFCALPFSMFAPLKIFGFLVIATIFICLVGALVIVPALVLLFRPYFLEPEFRAGYRGAWSAISGWLKGRKSIPAN